MFRSPVIRTSTAFGLLGACVAVASAAPGYIAGLVPDQRPAGAPVKADSPRTPEQMARYLRGVEGAPPGNVSQIVGTGDWWVPMRQPGMTAPYDLRGWHRAGTSAAPISPKR